MDANNPVHQYAYGSASRVGIATAESALGISDALQEYTSEPQPYDEAYPRLQWQRGPDSVTVRYGKLFIHDKVVARRVRILAAQRPGETGQLVPRFQQPTP